MNDEHYYVYLVYTLLLCNSHAILALSFTS